MKPRNTYFLTSAEGKRLSPDASKKFTESLGAFMTTPGTGTAERVCAMKQKDNNSPYTYRCFINGVAVRPSKKKV